MGSWPLSSTARSLLRNFRGLGRPLSNQKMSVEWIRASDVHQNRPLVGWVRGGKDRGVDLHVARAWHEGSLVPGKMHHIYNTVYVSYGGEEHSKDSFEILTGEGFEWKAAEGGNVPEWAFQGGHEVDGTPLYVAVGKINGVDAIGKVNPVHKRCYLPYGGKEHTVECYEVLVHNQCRTRSSSSSSSDSE